MMSAIACSWGGVGDWAERWIKRGYVSTLVYLVGGTAELRVEQPVHVDSHDISICAIWCDLVGNVWKAVLNPAAEAWHAHAHLRARRAAVKCCARSVVSRRPPVEDDGLHCEAD